MSVSCWPAETPGYCAQGSTGRGATQHPTTAGDAAATLLLTRPYDSGLCASNLPQLGGSLDDMLRRLMHGRKEDADDQEVPAACKEAAYETDVATLALAVLVRLTAHAGMCPLVRGHTCRMSSFAVKPASTCAVTQTMMHQGLVGQKLG